VTYFGETPTTDGDYTVVRFLQAGEFVTPYGVSEGEVLIVGGGGGGSCGGGGGGGVLTGTEWVSGTMPVTVGDGGPAGGSYVPGTIGGLSEFGSLVARGGGYGGNYGASGGNGASGGGQGGTGGGGDHGLATGSPLQGYDGGCPDYSAPYPGGGGGGAGGAAEHKAAATYGGAGGIGVESDISGATVGYGGGGGGGTFQGTDVAKVGTASHGGGAGAIAGYAGVPGTANTGGGGGGGGDGYGGGAGGSGIVVIRYLTLRIGAVSTAPVAIVSGSGTILTHSAVSTAPVAIVSGSGTIVDSFPEITIDGEYTVWEFATPGNGRFVVPPAPDGHLTAEVLIVAGGGGGGTAVSGGGAGGGAGGYLAYSSVDIYANTDILIGRGGAAQENGLNSSFADLVAIGGGAGSHSYDTGVGQYGGSGGGTEGSAFGGAGGLGEPGQGYDGGGGSDYSAHYPARGGGGGGAGGVGQHGSGTHESDTTTHAEGGVGVANDITGSSVTYAHGGQGAPFLAGDGADGVNPGDGGDGTWGGTPGSGASGIVVIRFLTPTIYGSLTTAASQVSGAVLVHNIYGAYGRLDVAAAKFDPAGAGGGNWSSVEGKLIAPSAIVHGWGSEPVYVDYGAMRSGRTNVAGLGAIVPYTGEQLGHGKSTIEAARIYGVGNCNLDGVLPPPDVPPVPIITWPPLPRTTLLEKGLHTLIGKIAVSIGGVNYTPYAENLECDSNVSGGYGTCTMLLRPPTPVPNFDDEVLVTCDTGEIWRGKVVNTPGITYTGEFARFQVVAEGPAKEHGRREDFSWTGSDSNVGSWKQLDCQNWNSPAGSKGFQISADTANGLRFQSADLEIGARPSHYFTPSEAAVHYDYYGNHPSDIPALSHLEGQTAWQGDCPAPEILWSAHYYQIGDGLSKEKATGLTAKARYDFRTPIIDALTIANLDAGTRKVLEDWPLDWAWADYEQINVWTDFYKMPTPGSLWAGLYVCDEPWQLPVQDPVAMLTDPHCVKLFERTALGKQFTTPAVYSKVDPVTGLPIDPVTQPEAYANGDYVWDENGYPVVLLEADDDVLTLSFSGKMIVFYSTFKVMQHPYSSNYGWQTLLAPHQVRPTPPKWKNWYAANEMYSEGKQFVELREVKVLANGLLSGPGDLTAAIVAASGGGDISVLTVKDGVDVKIDPFMTDLAAIETLVGMSAETLYWGWDPTFFCTPVRGTYALDGTQPGVTVSAGIKNEGTIDTATVIYSDSSNPTENRRVLAAWVPKSMTFDVNGDQVALLGLNSESSEYSGLIDGSYRLHKAAAAADAAQSYIVQRGISGDGPQWEGTVTLIGIKGAATMKVGCALNVGDVSGAIITAVKLNVDTDTVTLSLGGTGYQGRFPDIVGRANSAAPANALQRPPLPYKTGR